MVASMSDWHKQNSPWLVGATGYFVFRFLTAFGWKSRFGDLSYGRIK